MEKTKYGTDRWIFDGKERGEKDFSLAEQLLSYGIFIKKKKKDDAR